MDKSISLDIFRRVLTSYKNKLAGKADQDYVDKKEFVFVKDTRNDDRNPQWYMENYPYNMVFEFKYRNKVGDPPENASSGSNYTLIATFVPWHDKSGGYPTQVSFGKTIAIRLGTSETTWSSWSEVPSTDDIKTKLADMIKDPNNRTVTDEEKKTWNSKPDVVSLTLQEYLNLTTKKPNTIYLCKRS